MSLIVTTTGTTVEVLELGISIIHPSSLNLSDQFSAVEIKQASSLTTAIRSGSLTWKKTPVGAVQTPTDYDPDFVSLEDEATGDGLVLDRSPRWRDLDAQEAVATTAVTTSSSTYSDLGGMTLTTKYTGSYTVWFNASSFNSNKNRGAYFIVNVNGIDVVSSERLFLTSNTDQVASLVITVPALAGQVIKIRWSRTANTQTCGNRTMSIMRVR